MEKIGLKMIGTTDNQDKERNPMGEVPKMGRGV
jgi:hypothetical protein